MESDPLIQAAALTKAYRIWDSPSSRLAAPFLEATAAMLPGAPSRAMRARASRLYRDFYALTDVTFAVRPGEATGIIGRNGSGKSTLLQLIAGTLSPTSGSVSVRGRVSALLELGSGFNPDFTGRENVYINGAIHGFTRSQMHEKMGEIADFADIGDFIEQPVKMYSSGMMMRLAFAVAVNVQPDILIIDEALAVGDVFFSQKCFQRIREIVHRGATLIFVSHDMGAVQSLCDRALLLSAGTLAFDGAPEDCVSRYFSLHAAAPGTGAAISGSHPPVDPHARRAVVAGDILPGAKSRHGDRRLEVTAAVIIDGQGAPTWDYEIMHRACLRVLFTAREEVRRPSVGIQLHDRMGNLVFAAGTTQLRFPLPALGKGQEVLLEFRIALSLQEGSYTLSIDAAEFDEANPNVGTFFDRVGGLGPLRVAHHGGGSLPFYGMAQLPMEISYL
ncbi:MAG TPA: ABC transporter ATP-binding protein [Opitutaceae bacterium]|jgi:ABC-type polysaccharide/polyol phosphate transport system ATPase subunit